MASGKNLKVAAAQAGLDNAQKDQVDTLAKLLDTHQTLNNMPQKEAQRTFAKLPQEQQAGLINTFGGDTPEQPNRSGLGTIWHYTIGGLQNVGDFMTRAYRTGAIALEKSVDQVVNPQGPAQSALDIYKNAWKTADDNGEKVLNETRIRKAEEKYGPARVAVAIKVDQGTPLDQIIAGGTEEEKQIAVNADKGTDKLWQDTIDAVKAAKYSPGRQLANLLLPESLEGSGFLYKGISGTVDTAYRVFADPTLALGKAKKAYDVANYALFKIAGNAGAVDAVFRNPKVVGFFDTYGAELEKLATARKAKDLKAATEAATTLKRIAPEFGPTAVDEFINAGVKDALTAKNYLANHADVTNILKGQAARQTPLIPRMTAGRQARVALYAATDKVFNIDNVGQKIVTALYGKAPQYEDITTGLTKQTELIGELEKSVGRFKGKTGVERYSIDQIQGRLDRAARKFTTIPYFQNGFFDVMAPDASVQVYRVARLTNSRYHSKIIQEAFQAGDEGQRKQIFTGLWNTVAEIRGVSKSVNGKTYMDQFAGKGLEKAYAADIVIDGVNQGNPAVFNEQAMALFPYQLSSGMAVPSIVDLDRLSARSGLINWIVGISHNKWADRLTSGWVIGTLAGPRFAIRNAIEDLMIHLGIGDSPWGVVKGRLLSTRLRLSRGISGGESIAQAAKKTLTLDTEAGELGVIQKLVRRKELKQYREKMIVASQMGDVNDVRKVMAEALLNDSLGYKLDKRGAEILADTVQHSDVDTWLASVSEGGKNALQGGDRYLSVTSDVAKYGKMGAIEIDGVAYKQATGEKAFTQFNPVANQQSRISWLVQLGVAANDDLAKIAIRYLDNEKLALNAMRTYLKDLPQAELNRFQLYSAGGNIDVHAKRAYDAVRNLFSKNEGTEINKFLLNKVRVKDAKGNVVVSSSNLNLEDLAQIGDVASAPQFISGPTLVPVSDSNNFAASITDKAWDAMGEANARFSREPIVINELIRTRKEMQDSGFEQRFIEQLTRGLEGEKYDKALAYAKRQVVELAQGLARDRVLAYVDNPAVRSQLAMSSRNFARFYRATEDFYRRLARAVKYNPESIRRATLTYEGIAHSGFVQTDDTGEQYFFYPGLTPVYQVMSNLANAFGLPQGFSTPMPVEFSGKLKMITPSMNPDSLFPTFAGPLAAIPTKFVLGLNPTLNKMEGVLLGTYAQDQPMVSAIFPAHVNRLLASMDPDERNSQRASAFRKAATYLEAAGYSPKPKWDEVTKTWIAPSAGELEEYRSRLEASTITVLGLRFLFGFFAPAAPQVTLKSDMSNWARQNSRVNYKQVFNNLIQTYNGDIDKAVGEWIRLYPDQMPYTVSESDDNVVSVARAVDTTVKWVEKNGDLLKKYPQGAAFLMPKVGEFDFNAYRMLFKSGIKYNKTIDDYLRNVSTARDKTFYYDQKDAYEARLAVTYSDALKQKLRADWDAWSTQFKASRPLLQEELGKGAQTALARRAAYQDLQNMLNDKTVKVEAKTRSILKQMMTIYDNYKYMNDLQAGAGSQATAYKDVLKQNTKNQLLALAEQSPNAKDAYNTLFSNLIGN